MIDFEKEDWREALFDNVMPEPEEFIRVLADLVRQELQERQELEEKHNETVNENFIENVF